MARTLSNILLTLDVRKQEYKKELLQQQQARQDLAMKHEDEEEDEESEDDDEIVAERFKCLSLYKHDFARRGGSLYGQWKQEQRLRASRMELHLNQRWSLDHLIEEQLSKFDAHYSRAMGPCRPKDVAQLLMPKCRLPLEMAALAWLGNWRPSAILSLLHSFTSQSTTSRSPPSEHERVLSQLIRETRIEEAVLDEEMSEIQTTCILHLPFSPANEKIGSKMASVHSEFKKIHHVITRTQKLRYTTLELVVKKLLNRTLAAKFLVAFAGIQDMVHEFAAYRSRQKGPITLTIKASGM
ncbi:hypothetical protein GIB67_014980 [Kingdonia uniflora]|uniref:DOG1 domain-containing protein n=1 Tax=Kingdonia uniflora TaxID=39325 RepID=A0A7J7MTH3_9MAGN|nr:hypothetical protein GIB67_014980 [Kingdonia uniflora]